VSGMWHRWAAVDQGDGERMMKRGRTWIAVGLLGVLLPAVVACSSDKSDKSSSTTRSTTTTDDAGSRSSSTQPASAGGKVVVFGAEGNNLDAYEGTPPFKHQQVNAAFTPEAPQKSNPQGTDINAQICFFPDGSNRFIAGEDKGQKSGDRQGWGIFRLTGTSVGSFGINETAKLVPTYQSSSDNAENYGCGVLSDGRVLTTDVGDQANGAPDGQLIIWYPPFDSEKVKYCKLDVAISTAQSLLVDRDDNIFMAAARPTTVAGATGSGVWEYSPPYPTGPDAAGGCGKTDGTGAPLTDRVQKKVFIAPGEHGLLTPSGIAASPAGGYYVSSVFTGVINEYDRTGAFVRTILQPPPGESIGAKPYSTGTPLGIGISPDGTIYYADIGLVIDKGVGPGSKTGTERRITFTDGKPNPPEVMAQGLDYPDGIGIFVPPS
jgi:hypothetical protein